MTKHNQMLLSYLSLSKHFFDNKPQVWSYTCIKGVFNDSSKLFSVTWICRNNLQIKGALDNFSFIPQVFIKKFEILIPLEMYTYVVTAMLSNFNLIRKICEFGHHCLDGWIWHQPVQPPF